MKSVLENHLSEKIQIINNDLKKISHFFGKHSVEVVTCNPPYMIFNHGKQNPNEPKAIARHEIMCTLNDVVFAADYLLKTHGTFLYIPLDLQCISHNHRIKILVSNLCFCCLVFCFDTS